MNVTFVIPARGGSKRLPRKNMREVHGKPLLLWAIEACQRSIHYDAALNNVFVSTEDPEIISCAYRAGAQIIIRPEEYARDDVWTQDVLKHAIGQIGHSYHCGMKADDILVRVQANSPQVTSAVIDECVARLEFNELWEVFTVNRDTLVEDGAVHALRCHCVSQNALSVYKGITLTDYIDVHTEEDLRAVEALMADG